METKSKLFAALAKAQAEVKAAGKSGENKFDNYKYATLQDYWEAVQEPMSKNGLCFPVSVTAIERLPDRQTSMGKVEHVVQIELTGYLCHESGESMEFKCYGEGQDRSDKAIYKAVTGGKKYLIASVFNIPTTDDPETDSDAERGDPMDQRPPAEQKTTRLPQTLQGCMQARSRPTARRQERPSRQPPAQPQQEQNTADDLPWQPDAPQNPLGFKALPLPEKPDTDKIGQSEYDQLVAALHNKAVKKLKWLAYIEEKYGVKTVTDLTFGQFKEVFELIYANPAVIDPGMNF